MATVTYNISDADANVTITITDPDGTETTTTADASGAATITLDKEGEWSFTYDVGGTSTTNTRTVTAEELTDGDTETPVPEPTLGTDAIMHITEKQFQYALIRILQKNNERIVAHFTDKVTEGDTNHIPTSDTIYKAITQAIADATAAGAEDAKEYTDDQITKLAEDLAEINNWKYEEVIGDLPTDPDEKTIYLQIDNEDDLTHIMKIYSDGKWIDIGDTSIDLVEYWKKDNITGLTDALVDSEYFMSKLFGGNSTTTPEDTLDKEQSAGEPFIVSADPNTTVTAVNGSNTVTATTDESGKTILTLPTGGTWDVTVTRDGVEETKSTTVKDAPIVSTSKEITLTVTPNATVTATHPDGDVVTGTADESGSITLTLPKDGDWSIKVTDPDSGEESDNGSVKVEDKPTTTLTPLVINADPGTTVTATHPDGDEITAVAGEDGKAILVLPKEGAWSLSYTKDNTAVEPDEPVEVEKPTVNTTDPVILYADPGTTVTASHEDGVTTISAVAGEDGRAIFILPKDGAWSFSFTKNGNTTEIDVGSKDEENKPTSLDDRYWERSKLDELVETIDGTGEFFNRTNYVDYSNSWKLLGTTDNKAAAVTATGVTDDETITIKNSAVDALDNLTYIRDAKLAQLLGAVNEVEVGNRVEGTPATTGNEAAFTFAEITLPTAGEWKVVGKYYWDSAYHTDTFYITVSEDEAPYSATTYNAFNSTNLYTEIYAIKVERTLDTPLNTEKVKNTIVKTVEESGTLEKLDNTYLTLDSAHEAFGIPDDADINNETMESAIMDIVNKNSDKIEAITDEHLEALMNLAIEETVVTLANSGIATDEEVQQQIDDSFGK